MATRSSTTLAKQLVRAQLAIDGTLENPEILAAVTPVGYPTEAMIEGRTLFVNVQSLRASATTRRGSKSTTNQKASASERVARAAQTRLATVIRAVFPAAADRTTLGLAPGNAPDARPAFLAAAEKLFAACLGASPGLKARLAKFGYPDATLLSEQAKIAAFRAELTEQAGARGASEQETVALNLALSDLNAWVNQYRKLARVALAGSPQLLEKIGIAVKS
jgi:hypothetical protein